MTLLLADVFRFVRSKTLWVGIAITMLLSLYTAISTVAQVDGAALPQFTMTVAGTASEAETVPANATYTGTVGSFALGGGLLPLVTSILVALIVSEGVQGGFDKCLLSSGISRASLIGEQYALSIVLSAFMLALVSLPFAILHMLTPSIFTDSAPIAEVACWWMLAVMHTALYAFAAGLVSILVRQRAAGLLCAMLISSGVVEMLIVSLSENLFKASGLASLLPRSIAEMLSMGADALGLPYLSSVPLFAVALVVYISTTIAIGAFAATVYSKRSIL